MIGNEKREDPFTYEANAIAEGKQSGFHVFVQNRSETPEGAKNGLRSTARIRHVTEYKKGEEIELQNVEVYKLDSNNKPIEQVQ
jgi:hypothetical protein